MNTTATAFAQPPERRRRCGRSPRPSRRLARTRPESDRPPSRTTANDHPPPTRIDFATAPSFTSRSRRDPARSPKGSTA